MLIVGLRGKGKSNLINVLSGKPASTVVAPPGADPDEFERIVRSKLAGIDLPVEDIAGGGDAASPARKRYREFTGRMGAVGFSVGAVVKLVESEKMPTSRQTVHRWVSEDRDAGLVEPMGKFGSWKWRGGL